MKKFVIATLMAVTAFSTSAVQANALTKSYSEKDLLGKWQCDTKTDDLALNYVAEYRPDQKLLEKGDFDMTLDDTVFSYQISGVSSYQIKGNQIISILSDIEYMKPKHRAETLQKMKEDDTLADIDSFFGKLITLQAGIEQSLEIRTLNQKMMVLYDAEDESIVNCKRIK